MGNLEKWVQSFASSLSAEQDLADELRQSLAFHVYMFWLAGATPFPLNVPVEGGFNAMLLPNVSFRCDPAAICHKSVEGMKACHVKETMWALLEPLALSSWQPFASDDKLSAAVFQYLSDRGLAV